MPGGDLKTPPTPPGVPRGSRGRKGACTCVGGGGEKKAGRAEGRVRERLERRGAQLTLEQRGEGEKRGGGDDFPKFLNKRES